MMYFPYLLFSEFYNLSLAPNFSQYQVSEPSTLFSGLKNKEG